MPDRLSDSQVALLVAVVESHEEAARSSHVGDREDEDARALIRAGMAQWYPPILPMAHVGAQAAAERVLATRSRVVPTPKGRARVAEHKRRSEAAKKAARRRKRSKSK